MFIIMGGEVPRPPHPTEERNLTPSEEWQQLVDALIGKLWAGKLKPQELNLYYAAKARVEEEKAKLSINTQERKGHLDIMNFYNVLQKVSFKEKAQQWNLEGNSYLRTYANALEKII